MGRKKKGSNKLGQSNLKDAVSDEDIAGPGEEDIYDDVDAWDRDQDRALAAGLAKKGGRKQSQENMEMFALSGTDSDSDLELPKPKKKGGKRSEAEEQIQLNDEDFLGSDVEEAEGDNFRAWGSKKKHFYGGNTGSKLESSDSEYSENEAEEAEAKLLQDRHLDRMQEEDFLDTFIVNQQKPDKPETEADVDESVERDLSSLSQKERAALFRQQAPEFDGIVMDFQLKMAEAIQLSRIIGLEDAGKLSQGPATEFVRTKFQILTNYCTNISAYLMFRSKGTNLKLHPVTGRLVEYKQLIDSLQTMDAIMKPQIDSLLSRLDNGDSIDTILKEEKRRLKKKQMKKSAKSKTLKILQKKKADPAEQVDQQENSNSKKRKHSKIEDLTGDEKMAVELYKAIRRNKGDLESGESASEEEEEEEEAVDKPMHNDDVDLGADEGDGERRAITYKIAKNKGLMPKRNKLQRNPRVKNRVKFEKAKKRRKGAVREPRKETKRYAGEISGINARVKKGVKLG